MGEASTTDFLDAIPADRLEGCLLVGYYGGGNYGDELLLEVVMRRLRRRGVRRAAFVYRAPGAYRTFHRDHGYRMVDGRRPWSALAALLRARSVIVGGGGLWGMDANRNVLLLSFVIFLTRRLLGKPVYLLGVGYYRTSRLPGRVGAPLAAWGSTLILARDGETGAGFRRFTSRVRQDRDLALYIDERDILDHRAEAAVLDENLDVGTSGPRAVFIGLRRFRDDRGGRFLATLERLVGAYPDRNFVFAVLEPREVDPGNYAAARRLALACPNVTVLDFACNPLALVAWLCAHRDRLVMIAPQYHAIASAHLAGIPIFPLVYDNKTGQLVADIGLGRGRPMREVCLADLCRFLDTTPAAPGGSPSGDGSGPPGAREHAAAAGGHHADHPPPLGLGRLAVEP